jgi:xanthine dehydrogenase accessory factor
MTWESTPAAGETWGSIDYFVEWLKKPTHLHLFGAGPDADGMYELTVALGWEISIYDHRRGLLDQRRFPRACRLTHTYYEDDWTPPDFDWDCPCVVMTHNLPRDLLLIPKLMSSGSGYVGVLGAQKRAAVLRDALRQNGFSDAVLAKLRSPIGLDIGARDPWTIALAILAEIQSYLHQTANGHSHSGEGRDI